MRLMFDGCVLMCLTCFHCLISFAISFDYGSISEPMSSPNPP
jgi:hypothetical protein